MSNIIVAALYKFAGLPDYRELQSHLLDFCVAHELKGTLLLAPEGINGTVAGTRTGIDALISLLRCDPRFVDMEHKESSAHEMPFGKFGHRIAVAQRVLVMPRKCCHLALERIGFAATARTL